MKVPNLSSSKSAMRVVAAVSLAWALVAAGASAPLSASAEEAPITATPAAVAEATATAAFDVTATVAAPSVVATPVVKTAAKKKLTVRQKITKVGTAAGLSKAEIKALMWIAKRESNFHPTSKSKSGCYGLFQLSRGMAGGHPWKNPEWNTKRAIKYMKGRYHGVLKAKAFWQSHHWY